ncbi:MAG: tetratricopeptide repeat protein [Thermomicrobiales bacterium]
MNEPDLPTGTVAFLFTDIEGSTRRWERDPATMRRIVDRHFELLDSAIATHGGIRFKTVGDAVQAAFPTVAAAVSAALDGERALHAESWLDGQPLLVRAAVHVGEATPVGRDYLAPALNRLARLLSAGHGGQILLTDAAANLVRASLPAGAALRDLGVHRLRDLTDAEPVFQIVHPDVPHEFPPLLSLDRQLHNLPAPANPLIGRTTELAQVTDLLNEPAVRLLTLTGPGGVGKTRLALEAAITDFSAFPDGVWFVDLASIQDHTLVLPAIARVLGVREGDGRPLPDLVADYLKPRTLLLVLDNLEHLLRAAPRIAELLAAAPGLRVLATSRAPLRIRGEREFAVPPLDAPSASFGTATIASALDSNAVQLFVDRARAARPAFDVTEDNVNAVVEICRRLDGLPLAIELAAARVRVLPPRELLTRLEDRLKLLSSGSRDAPARQQTLHAAIAWSHDLLSEEAQIAFRRLAVFAGAPTLTSIEAVVDIEASAATFDAVASLVEESLLQQTIDATGESRFGMLQTIRAYAQEQLTQSLELQVVCERHAGHFLAFADVARPDLTGSRQGELLATFETDHDEFRAALRFLIGDQASQRAFRLAGTLWWFWWLRGYLSEGMAWMEQVLALPGEVPIPDRIAILTGAGSIAEAQGNYTRAIALHEEALRLAETAGDDHEAARVQLALAVIAQDHGHFDAARQKFEAALPRFRAANDDAGAAQALVGLGTVAAQRGDTTAASLHLTEGVALLRALGDAWGLGTALSNLGRLAFLNGDLDQAVQCYDEALGIFRAVGARASEGLLLSNLGEVRFRRGDFQQADDLYQHALVLLQEIGDQRAMASTLVTQAEIEIGREAFDLAASLLEEAATLSRATGDTEGMARGLEVFATLAAARHEFDKAARACGAAASLREHIGAPLAPIYVSEHDRLVATIHSELGDEPFRRAALIGASLSPDDLPVVFFR